ncbi:protein spaetzle 5 [Lutzomyia longipalpis]|uniref:protein spaetzle 5 n=1 Tax=Lutzomyia longipalpis TaxID=7200 RepID=UPI00248428E1|nr:protein spaetzle 5 [Lutzomyia longipalpis]
MRVAMYKFLWLFVIIKLVGSEAPYPHNHHHQQYVPYQQQRPQLQCGLYGAPPCEYVPAPPGNTPTCAGPGKTYCEHVDHYPVQVIKTLIDKWGYDVQPHIVDETGDEFHDRKVTPHPTYGPPSPTYGPPAPTYGVPGVPATPPVPASYQPPPPPPSDTSTPAPVFSSNLIGPANNNFASFARGNAAPAGGYTNNGGYSYNPPRTSFVANKPQQEFFTPQTGVTAPNALGTGIGKNGNGINGNGFNGQPINVVFTEALRAPPQDNNFISPRAVNQPQIPFNPQQQLQPPFTPPLNTANPTQVSPSQTTFKNPPPQGNQNNFPVNQNNFPTNQNNYQNLNYFPLNFNQPGGDTRLQQQQQPPQTHYNPADWFRRYGRSVSEAEVKPTVTDIVKQEIRSFNESLVRVKRESLESLLLDESKLPENAGLRNKRQAFDQDALCQVRTQFIQPQAALNSKGNWMFVVNQVETARQLVKTETCASTVCSNICQIPPGYNSRCEQKYVQKRLVALDANGQRLYTDTFWFPSCCVCTISQN